MRLPSEEHALTEESVKPPDCIVELKGVSKSFARPDGKPLLVLSDINLELRDGEMLGLLGRSGSGKSTLLRITGGLIEPNSGAVHYRGAPLAGPAEGIAIVFQTFALFPWLTVMQNVEAGLDALGLSRADAKKRAQSAIDLIGLDGFQSAYPRELSGGMRQRVGFARALVTDPALLLMDEPFSALDVLTAETLRTDFLDLWMEHELPIKAALMVTHNIEEAVLMCDRILVLSSNPGTIAAEIPVTLARPRDRFSSAFRDIVDEIYATLTSRALASLKAHGSAHGGIGQGLPPATVNQMTGLLERVSTSPYDGCAQLAEISRAHVLEVDDLFPIAEALHILEFAELTEDQFKLTAAGRLFAHGGIEDRKILFREHLLKFVPLVAHMCRVLDERADHTAPRARFEMELEDHLTCVDAEKTLRTATGWGRYAELFNYDDSRRVFSLAPSYGQWSLIGATRSNAA